MDDVLAKVRMAALAKKPVIILNGMGPKLGFDRCAQIWKTLLSAGYQQADRKPSGTSDTLFTETWELAPPRNKERS